MKLQRTFRQATYLGLAATFVTALLGTPAAWASSVEDRLQDAQDSFLFGDFGAAATGVIGLIEQGGLTPALLREANVLAAQCYLELGDEAAVDAAICAAHDADPLWQPSTNVLTEREVLRFATALRSCPEATRNTTPFFRNSPSGVDAGIAPAGAQPQSAISQNPDPATSLDPTGGDAGSSSWLKKPVTWIVGGTAAAVGVVLAMAGGGSGGDDPGAPSTPGGIGDFPAAPED